MTRLFSAHLCIYNKEFPDDDVLSYSETFESESFEQATRDATLYVRGYNGAQERVGLSDGNVMYLHTFKALDVWF